MRVTILTGGASAERDVALASARQVLAALRQSGHEVRVVDTIRGALSSQEEDSLGVKVGTEPPTTAALDELERQFLLSEMGRLPEIREADVLFLALHGGRGEDGTVQAILGTLGVPYTGSGPLASGLGMDKDLSKRLFRLAGVPTPDWMMAPVTAAEVARRLQWPVVVKPSKQGSTVGLTVVKRAQDFDPAVTLAAKYDDEVMIEAFIPGRRRPALCLAQDSQAGAIRGQDARRPVGGPIVDTQELEAIRAVVKLQQRLHTIPHRLLGVVDGHDYGHSRAVAPVSGRGRLKHDRASVREG